MVEDDLGALGVGGSGRFAGSERGREFFERAGLVVVDEFEQSEPDRIDDLADQFLDVAVSLEQRRKDRGVGRWLTDQFGARLDVSVDEVGSSEFRQVSVYQVDPDLVASSAVRRIVSRSLEQFGRQLRERLSAVALEELEEIEPSRMAKHLVSLSGNVAQWG